MQDHGKSCTAWLAKALVGSACGRSDGRREQADTECAPCSYGTHTEKDKHPKTPATIDLAHTAGMIRCCASAVTEKEDETHRVRWGFGSSRPNRVALGSRRRRESSTQLNNVHAQNLVG